MPSHPYFVGIKMQRCREAFTSLRFKIALSCFFATPGFAVAGTASTQVPVAEPALAQLRDIHLPEPIGWWPLAPGWYLLGFFVLSLAVILAYTIRRYILNGRAKREALK